MLVALKKRATETFFSYLQQGHDPFVPSPFGQCCGGFGLYNEVKKYIPKLQPFDPKEWVVRSDLWMFEVSTRRGFRPSLVHVTDSRLAYTLPYLSGIHLAAATNQLQAIYNLKDQVNKLDAFGYLPIVYAMGNFNQEAIEALKTLQPDSYMPLQGAYLMPHYGIVASAFYDFRAGLAKQFNVIPVHPAKSAVSKSKTIHQAAAFGDIDTLQKLIQSGVDVNIQSYNGSTALICSVLYGNLEACEFLLKSGANPNLYNYLDETPSMLLRQMGEKQQGWPIFNGQNSEELKRRKFDVNIFKKFLKLFGISFSEPVKVHQEASDIEDDIEADEIKPNQVTDTDVVSDADTLTSEQNQVKTNQIESSKSTASIIDGIVSAAIAGDFQLMVSYVLSLTEDNRQKLPLDTLARIKSESQQDTDFIASWLIVNTNCKTPEIEELETNNERIDIEQFDAANQSTYHLLKWMKDGHSLSEGGKLLALAESQANTDFCKWLLRMGVAEPPQRVSSDFFAHLIEKTVESRNAFVDSVPTLINDELLFAVTTGNVELLLDYIDYGFSWENGVTRYNLNLQQILALKPDENISQVLLALKEGKSVEKIRKDGGKDPTTASKDPDVDLYVDDIDLDELEGDEFKDGDLIVNFGDLDYQKEDQKRGTTDSAKEDLVEAKSEINEKEEIEEERDNKNLEKILLKADINNPKLFDTLNIIFHPPFMVKLFLRAQNCLSDEDLMALVDNDSVTLELFRAMKLYADDKFCN